MKRPSFQFYPSDWLRDTALRTCSVGARGLWIDMICFMHEGNPYGTLKVGNKVILPSNLSVMVGATLQDVEGWLEELELANVFDRGTDGEIMSRRMIRDEYLRNVRAEGGKKGGNPALMDKPKVGGKVNLEDKPKPTPSSSSSSPSSPSSNSPLDNAPPPPKKPKVPKMSDEQFIQSLKTNPAYQGIDIDNEIGRMNAWLLTKPNRKLTRPFIVNWLNRIDQPMEIQPANTPRCHPGEMTPKKKPLPMAYGIDPTQ